MDLGEEVEMGTVILQHGRGGLKERAGEGFGMVRMAAVDATVELAASFISETSI